MVNEPSCYDCGRLLIFEIDGFHFRCQDCLWKMLEGQITTNNTSDDLGRKP